MKNKNLLSFGLIGKGHFGLILREALKKLGCLKWELDSNLDFTSFERTDWVFIATPNVLHYEQAEYFLKIGVNVFIEKPSVLNPDALCNLIDIANKNNVLLYISDVFLFDERITNNIISDNPYQFYWQKKIDNQKTSIIDRLTYHHLYLIYNKINKSNPKLLVNNINLLNSSEIDLDISIAGYNYKLSYRRSHTDVKKHIIFGSILEGVNNDSVFLMLKSIIQKSVDFNKNHQRSLWVLKCIVNIKENAYKNVAVVGGGIFGCTSAIELAKRGHKVTLYEQHEDIMLETSSINQYRVHRGYHYPRSFDTASSCKQSSIDFVKAFRQAIVKDNNIEHYYAIAKTNSLTSPTQYLEFLNLVGLDYEIVKNIPNTSLTVKVHERLYDPDLLRDIIKKRLKGSNVEIKLGFKASHNEIKNHDASVLATYSSLNDWNPKPVSYKYQLCEKPVFKLPATYQNKSIVIMDGPFMCIDPYGESGYHVLGNVVHAIHSTNTGDYPKIPRGFEGLLNNGIIKNPSITKVADFIESALPFFSDIKDSIHIGSMYTFRVVKPNLEKTDARPTLIDSISSSMFSVFSGKVCTSLFSAKELANLIEIDYIS
tara:strand:- start:2400 stop:4190 length:1791 start_codon:yes stop_codon:yes gene_type:complete